jgi:hypothetical protein
MRALRGILTSTFWATAAATICITTTFAAPVGTAFTYQGSLSSAGQPANGTFDIRFALHTNAAGGVIGGEYLASASADQTIRLWITQLDTLVELGCQTVRRNLSQAEWDRYLPDEPYHRTCANLPSGQGAPADAPAATE